MSLQDYSVVAEEPDSGTRIRIPFIHLTQLADDSYVRRREKVEKMEKY